MPADSNRGGLLFVSKPLDFDKPTCDTFVEAFHVDYRGTGLEKEGFCDLFITKGVMHGQPVKPVPARSKESHTDKLAIGIVIKREHERVKKHLLQYDWCANANLSSNRNQNFTKDIIHRAVIEGGFID